MPILPENFTRWLLATLELLAALFIFMLIALVLAAM
jgi:hypothetical protein